MVKIQESSGRYSITIPADLIKKKKWRKGKELIIILNNKGNLEILEM
jgi:bifunctional DNA-binding transcriptional regulator/antitoxin component of YhaV-PrlF toxin-antitoxin module